MILLLLTSLAWSDATIDAYRDICRERIINIADHIQNKKAMVHTPFIQGEPKNHFMFKTVDDDASILFCGVIFDAFVDLSKDSFTTTHRKDATVLDRRSRDLCEYTQAYSRRFI